jgi:rRNA maturation RNase YbeY
VAISFHNEGIKFQFGQKIRHQHWISQYIRHHKKVPGSITFIFTSNKHLRRINREYLKHNYFTDVISFDYSEKRIVSGDVFISVDQVKKNAAIYAVEWEEELRRVMIHGILHLMGYNDREQKEREQMRKLEDEALFLWSQ